MMRLYNAPKDCFGCGACAAACPQKAIAMKWDSEGFAYPAVDGSLCVDCGLCKEACPAGRPPAQREGRFFAVRCRDEALLRSSTSGGAFSLIAEDVLSGGGLVCGACFDEAFRVVHRLSTEIAPMRKSKYVQSDMLRCFAPIRDEIASGGTVLFTGTPCQCQGLLTFLGGRPENLHMLCLVCRGVASPGLWGEYLQWLGHGGTLEAFDFRDKRRRNSGHTVAYTVDGAETAVSIHQDGFSRLYQLGLTYRPSCYACPYCSPGNDFDFTIGDFWGVEKCVPGLADGRGTSLVIVRGHWAEMLMERLRDRAEIVPCSREDAMQPSLLSPAKEPLLRRFLFRDFAKKDRAGMCDIPLLLKKYGAFPVASSTQEGIGAL